MTPIGQLLRLLIPSAIANARLHRPGWDVKLVSASGRPPRVVRGGHVRIGSRLAIAGEQGPVEIGAVVGGRLEIGDRAFINHSASIIAHRFIRIGDDARIGEYVAIFDTDHHPLTPDVSARVLPVILGKNVWIGRGAVILPGVEIGDNAVVAAGSIVTKSVPAGVLVAGNPAHVIKELPFIREGWRRP